MEVIRSWWEVPCIAHFCHIFHKPFKLPSFEIEELEDALLLDSLQSPSKLIIDLFRSFLNGIIDSHTEITEENWPLLLKLHLKWRCEHLKEKWNPLSGDSEYKDLDNYSRISIIHKLCHWRLELDDIADLLRGMDGPSLRLEPVGRDMDGNTYWYFFGTRLYKEEPKKKKKRKKNDSSEPGTPVPSANKKGKEGEGVANQGKSSRSKGATTPSSRRGRTKQVVQDNTTPSGRPGGRGGRTTRRSRQVLENGSYNGDKEGEESGRLEQEEEELEENEESTKQQEVEGEERGGCGEQVKEDGEEEEEEEDNMSESKASQPVEEKSGEVIPSTGWSVACTTAEEWTAVIETLQKSKHAETKRLVRALQDFLCEVEHILSVQEKQLKKRMRAEMPRRTSDRIAIKAAIKEEEEKLDAMERERQREELRQLEAEEQRIKEEEAEKKRLKRMEEALQRRKVREEQQQKQRLEEESNWEKAMSGELTGRRKAAIGAAENVSEVQRMAEDFMLTDDKDFDIFVAMYKILSGLRKHEEAWVFEDPVTEAIAPGYFEVVSKPMDYVTIEKKLEEQAYKSKDEFVTDMELIFENCREYNGDDSEYSELADETKKLFHSLVKVHLEGKVPDEDKVEIKGKKGRSRESRSPSACKTPELTSESSSEEDSDDGSDESYVEDGRVRAKPKFSGLKLPPSIEQRLGPGGMPPRMPPGHHHPPNMPPHIPPHLYNHYLHMASHGRMPVPRPPHHLPSGPPDMFQPQPGAPYPSPRLPPPYPGFNERNPTSGSPPFPPPDRGGMYPLPPHHQQHHPPPPDMLPPRPMYPPPNHYPPHFPHTSSPSPHPPLPSHPPHPSHPSHPAHPHHAAYRQHMFYEMQYRMDPRAAGMGMRPGINSRVGMEQFHRMRPLHSDITKSRNSESPRTEHKSTEKPVDMEDKEESRNMTEETQANRDDVGSDEKQGESGDQGSSNQKQTEGERSKNQEQESKESKSGSIDEEKEKVADEGSSEKGDCSKEDVKAVTASATASGVEKGEGGMVGRARMTPTQIEKYRYQMALHQQKREAMARGYPPSHHSAHPPYHSTHPSHHHQQQHPDEAAAAAFYAHQQQLYGSHNFPSGLHGDPRQLEAAHHHHWMEMEAQRRHHYAMMKHAQYSRQQQQQQQQKPPPSTSPQALRGGKERSAETGQEGLEEGPNSQEALRRPAQSQEKDGHSLSSPRAEGTHDTAASSGSGTPDNQELVATEGQEKTVNHFDKRKGADQPPFSPPQQYPPSPLVPNGYPYPYHQMPPYHQHQQHPGHAHQMPPPEEAARNGMGYPPLHGYYPPSYRMPYYPPHPNVHKQMQDHEMWARASPGKHPAQEPPENAPPVKKSRPSSES